MSSYKKGDLVKEFLFQEDATHAAIIFEAGSEAHRLNLIGEPAVPDTDGLVVGTSEWGWISAENGRRICAALTYFSDIPTEEIERLANEKVKARQGKPCEPFE